MSARGRSQSIKTGGFKQTTLSISAIFAIGHITCERKNNRVRGEEQENSRSFLNRNGKTPRGLLFYALVLTFTKRPRCTRRTRRNAWSEASAPQALDSSPNKNGGMFPAPPAQRYLFLPPTAIHRSNYQTACRTGHRRNPQTTDTLSGFCAAACPEPQVPYQDRRLQYGLTL